MTDRSSARLKRKAFVDAWNETNDFSDFELLHWLISIVFFFIYIPMHIYGIYIRYKININDEKYLSDGSHTIYKFGKWNQRENKICLTLLNGKRSGLYEEFLKNSNRICRINYKDGQKDGSSEFWEYNESGNLLKKYSLISGDGDIEEVIKYDKNGPLSGSYEEWDYNKQFIEKLINYKDGKKHGAYIEYNQDGNKVFECNYKNGVQDGKTLTYREDGSLFRQSNLENGKYSGDCFEYYDNGNTRMIYNEGEYIFFSEDGIKRCEVSICIEAVDGKIFGNRRPDFIGKWTNKGIWKNFLDDGGIDYELSDWNHKKNQVMKKTYTGYKDLYESSLVTFKMLEFAHLKFLPEFVPYRKSNSKYTWNSGIMGPGGASVWGVTPIKIQPILGIEDLLQFRTIESDHNE